MPYFSQKLNVYMSIYIQVWAVIPISNKTNIVTTIFWFYGRYANLNPTKLVWKEQNLPRF